MKALESLRLQLVRDYPDDSPAFSKALTSSKEARPFFNNHVIPAFEKIKNEFKSFHFEVNIRKYALVTRLDIKDGCSYFSFSVKISRAYACVTLLIFYRDESICSFNYEERLLLEERFDLSKINQDLPEKLIITIFSDTFINRKKYLGKIVETESNEKREAEELLREERRARLISLCHHNDKSDPEDKFRKYLDSPEYSAILSLLDRISEDNAL